MSIDAIIILGGGVGKKGNVLTSTKERLDEFLKHQNFYNLPVILSGRWSGALKYAPKITEAQAMKNYLAAKGVNPKRLLQEEQSLDTISNAVFSKKIIQKHSWKNILLLTSEGHIKRAVWIFRKIFGSDYKINPLPAKSKIKNSKRLVYEKYLLAMTKRILKNNKLTAPRELLKFHPFYSNSPQAKQLLKEAAAAHRDIYGSE